MNKRSIAELLTSVRERTLSIIQPFSEESLVNKFNELMGPVAWDIQHCAEIENLWTTRIDQKMDDCVDDTGMLPSFFDPFQTPRKSRDPQGRLKLDAVLARLTEVRERSLQLLDEFTPDDRYPLTRNFFLWRMLAQHEVWHTETMLVAINMLPDTAWEGVRLPIVSEPGSVSAKVDDTEMVEVQGGEWVMGTSDYGDPYDNEMPAHIVNTPSFLIDRFPVSNRRYIEYLEKTNAAAPFGWERTSDGWVKRWFGKKIPIEPDFPVFGVSHDESVAFADFIGKRLATDEEWEKAASWDVTKGGKRMYPWGDHPPTSDTCYVGGSVAGGPSRIGSLPKGRSFYGCEHMLGDCWEWVQERLYLFDGFKPWPYFGFTMPFVGKDRIIRGGSWAVGTPLIRNTLRNWDLPVRKQIFSGIRCVKSI
jgi:gamma-glutamyl hercynylcysteine S-oxide synthase